MQPRILIVYTGGTIGMTEYPIWCDGTVDDGRTDISYMVDAPLTSITWR